MVLAFCAMFSLVPTSRAADANIGANVATITVSPKLTVADAESAIQQALIGRKWVVRDKAPGQIVAHYERGKNVATLTIRYDSSKIEIYALGQSRNGGAPTNWINFLKSDIDVFLGRALLSK